MKELKTVKNWHKEFQFISFFASFLQLEKIMRRDIHGKY